MCFGSKENALLHTPAQSYTCPTALSPLPRLLRSSNAETETTWASCTHALKRQPLFSVAPLVPQVFGFVQTLTGCEDQARLFKDEVRCKCGVGARGHHVLGVAGNRCPSLALLLPSQSQRPTSQGKKIWPGLRPGVVGRGHVFCVILRKDTSWRQDPFTRLHYAYLLFDKLTCTCQ